MSQEAVEKFLGRLITDDAFRRLAASDPVHAARQEGFSLTDEELRAVTARDLLRLAWVAEELDGRIKRFTRT